MKYKDKFYDMLGIPTKDEKDPYFWIVTNVHDNTNPPDYVFLMGIGQKFYLPCSYLTTLEQEQQLDEVVVAFLRARCLPE